MGDVIYRTGGPEDSYTVFQVFHSTITDFSRRAGYSQDPVEEPAEPLEQAWQKWRALFDHLAETGENFCLAEVNGQVIGYARTVFRDGMRELSEFFVQPGQQSGGVGRELLARVFTHEGAKHRSIIATTDIRALARYLKTGVYARFPIYNFSREPRALEVKTDLAFEPMSAASNPLEAIRAVDRAVLGYTRDVDHEWWMAGRRGYLYWRGNQLAGYGYIDHDGGPFALLEEADYPAVLAHAEQIASQHVSRFHIDVPLVNRSAVDYLLENDYVMSPFTALLMSDQPFGQFENYILPSPPFTL